jgi:hypothetical protein
MIELFLFRFTVKGTILSIIYSFSACCGGPLYMAQRYIAISAKSEKQVLHL